MDLLDRSGDDGCVDGDGTVEKVGLSWNAIPEATSYEVHQRLASRTTYYFQVRAMKAAGVGKGAFYNYFETKEDLLVAGMAIMQENETSLTQANVLFSASM